jgi:hypothetical protein
LKKTMRNRTLLLLVFWGIISLSTNVQLLPVSHGIAAAPQVFSSPINASCIQVGPSECKLHVDPFTINVLPGQRLEAFQLLANSSPIYDFRTDISNPPSGNYSPSAVRLEFAAACGATYTINLLARDSGDTNFLNAGQVQDVICPVGEPTPTPLPTPTLVPPRHILSLPLVVH